MVQVKALVQKLIVRSNRQNDLTSMGGQSGVVSGSNREMEEGQIALKAELAVSLLGWEEKVEAVVLILLVF